MASNGSATYTYDAENRLIAAYMITTGQADPNCDPSKGACQSNIVITKIPGHFGLTGISLVYPQSDALWSLAYGVFVQNGQVLRTAGATLNDIRTIGGFYGLSTAAALGGGYYAGGEVFDAAANLSPEVISNVTDFLAGLDPNPAGVIAATFGGLAALSSTARMI
jgi:hypothetical protein